MNHMKTPWEVVDGSIRTIATEQVRTAGGRTIKVHHYIAFNVGEPAHHIVALHNASLTPATSFNAQTLAGTSTLHLGT